MVPWRTRGPTRGQAESEEDAQAEAEAEEEDGLVLEEGRGFEGC
jgi:hypothetical protein